MTGRIDPEEFAGARVVVSGGTRGLGLAVTARFAAAGARIVTAARRAGEAPARVHVIEADLSTAQGAAQLAAGALERLGASMSWFMWSGARPRPVGASRPSPTLCGRGSST